jgi:hypothetical protein
VQFEGDGAVDGSWPVALEEVLVGVRGVELHQSDGVGIGQMGSQHSCDEGLARAGWPVEHDLLPGGQQVDDLL